MGFNSVLPGMPADRCVRDAVGTPKIPSANTGDTAERRGKHSVFDPLQAKKTRSSDRALNTLRVLVNAPHVDSRQRLANH
jgi:hypothetical protein